MWKVVSWFVSFTAPVIATPAVIVGGTVGATVATVWLTVGGYVMAFLDPATAVNAAADLLGSALDFSGDLFGVDLFEPISAFLKSGVLGDLIDLLFYFVSPLVYVKFACAVIAIVGYAWVVAVVLKCVMWIKALFWSAPA